MQTPVTARRDGITEELVGCMDVLEQIEMYLKPHNPGFVNPHKHVDRVDPLLRAAFEEIKVLRDALHPHKGTKGTKSLVLYFDNDTDRQEFVEAFKEVKPNARSYSV
jgi:hypothetical protein